MRIKTCAICGKTFTPKSVNHKYCSDACRKIVEQFRNAEIAEKHKHDPEWHAKKAANSKRWYHNNKRGKDNVRSVNN